MKKSTAERLGKITNKLVIDSITKCHEISDNHHEFLMHIHNVVCNILALSISGIIDEDVGLKNLPNTVKFVDEQLNEIRNRVKTHIFEVLAKKAELNND